MEPTYAVRYIDSERPMEYAWFVSMTDAKAFLDWVHRVSGSVHSEIVDTYPRPTQQQAEAWEEGFYSRNMVLGKTPVNPYTDTKEPDYEH